MTKPKNIEIINRKAKFEYFFIQKFEAGIVLKGTEVKSIKQGNANMNDAYCAFKRDELFVKNLFIAEYDRGNIHNHDTREDRKLLLNKRELKKLKRAVNEKNQTIVPYRIYTNERGIIKIEIALAEGKKRYDKRQSIKAKDTKRDLDRQLRKKF